MPGAGGLATFEGVGKLCIMPGATPFGAMAWAGFGMPGGTGLAIMPGGAGLATIPGGTGLWGPGGAG